MAERTYTQPVQPPYYDDEIDLRVYIKIIIRHWRLIIIAALLAALGAGLASFVQRITHVPEYQAISLITTDQVGLATSDQLLQQLQSSLRSDMSLDQLRDMISTGAIDNTPPLIEFKVRSTNPQQATEIANSWANLFVQSVTNVKTGSGDEDDQVLVQKAQLNFWDAEYSRFLSEQQQIAQLMLDVEVFRTQLASQSPATLVTSTDQLTAILLQLKAFNISTSSNLTLPPEQSVSTLVASLDQLLVTLQQKSEQINTLLTHLHPDMFDEQGHIKMAEGESSELNKHLAIAQNALAIQIEKERVASTLSATPVKVVSEATVPQEPIPVTSNTLRNILLATVVGLMIGLGVAFLIEYMREEPTEDEQVTPEE